MGNVVRVGMKFMWTDSHENCSSCVNVVHVKGNSYEKCSSCVKTVFIGK